MEKLYYATKEHITHFKLDYCCWFAPVRIGLIIIGCTNIIVDLVCLMGISNNGLSPTITKVQEALIKDYVSKPIPMLAYTTELSFNVLLLCAIFRRDQTLLRVFMYYTFMAVFTSIMAYSIVFAAVPLHIQVAIVVSIIFQMYDILVVRSVMVEWRMEDKKHDLPKMVMSSLFKGKPTSCIYDPNKGTLKDLTIAEVLRKQQVLVTVVDQNNKINDSKVIEINNITEEKLDTGVKINAELKKGAEVRLLIEPKKNDKYKSELERQKIEHKIIGCKTEEIKVDDGTETEERSKERKKKGRKKLTYFIFKKHKGHRYAERKANTKSLKGTTLETVTEDATE